MASYIVCAVLDKKVGAFMQPFHVRSKGEGVRVFLDAMGDGKTPLSRYPEDYSLYVVSTFNDVDGVFTSQVDHECLMTGEVAQATWKMKFSDAMFRPNTADPS